MKLVPLGDKIVLKQLEAEETTKSGIVLPGQAKEKPQEAEVIAVGPGGNIDGKEVVMQVKAGDKVIYSKYAGTDIEYGKEYRHNEFLGSLYGLSETDKAHHRTVPGLRNTFH